MKCPKCGSQNSASILYGLPVRDENFNLHPDLQARIDRKEVILGGCCRFINSPVSFCLDCKFKYGSAPYYFYDENANCFEETNYRDYRRTIKSFCFTCGGFFQGHKSIQIEKKDGEITMTVIPPFKRHFEGITKTITSDEWYSFLDRIYSDFLLHEWDNRYDNNDDLDGVQWEIKIQMENNTMIEYYGSNEYPAYWKEFLSFINGVIIYSGEHFH